MTGNKILEEAEVVELMTPELKALWRRYMGHPTQTLCVYLSGVLEDVDDWIWEMEEE